MEQHFRHSSFREKLIEHLFVGELLKLSWQHGDCSLEVAKPEVDNRGYDIIVERNGIVRHIQLKASHHTARAAGQKVHVALAQKPSGCIVWIRFDEQTLDIGPFLFFGGEAGKPLTSLEGFKVARHTKANMHGVKAEKPEHRIVPKSKFRELTSAQDVFRELFVRVPGCAMAQASSPALPTMEHHFHRLITDRLAQFHVQAPELLPTIDAPLPDAGMPLWFPVSGMYGGFSYWLESAAKEPTLHIESWSRVIGGSGQRHAITAGGIVLLEEGFI